MEQMKRLVACAERRNPSPRTTAGSSPAERWKRGPIEPECKWTSFGEVGPFRTATSRVSTGRLRDECLNGEVFFNLADAREKIERWRSDYNRNRPHSALADRTPAEFVSAAECWPPSFSHRKIKVEFRRLLAAGIRSIRLYDLRHTTATLAVAAGVSVKVISDQLGHASISFTLERDSYMLPSIQDEAAAKVERMLMG